MKFISLFFLFCMSITLISCGDKDESIEGSGTVSSSLSTADGFYSLNNPTAPIEALGVSYTVHDQQSMIVIHQALAKAQIKKVRPIKVNGITKYRVRFEGEVIQLKSKEDLSYPEYNPHQGKSVLQLSSAEFY